MSAPKSWIERYAEFALAQALITGLRRLPRPAALGAAKGAARLLDWSVPKLRRVARTNLGFAYPQLSEQERERLIDGVFASLARLLLSIARFPDFDCGNISQWVSYDGLEHYNRAKECGRGVLVATAHLGNWELSAFSHALMREAMNIMVRPLDNPLIDRIVEERRTLSGNRLIYKRDAARSVLRALKNNEAVGVLIDQNTSLPEGLFVNFFGKPACAGSAFVKLAYHAKAPVVPGFALWEQALGRYVLRFYPPVTMTGDEQADTQAIHSAIEGVIRQYPDQWMWIHRRWKTRPPGEPPLYERAAPEQ